MKELFALSPTFNGLLQASGMGGGGGHIRNSGVLRGGKRGDAASSSPVKFSWRPQGHFLATAGANGIVNIVDKSGQPVTHFALSTKSTPVGLEWDAQGEELAAIQGDTSDVTLFDFNARSSKTLETSLKNPTFVRWSKTGPYLAIGDSKGNVLLYDKQSKKKVPILGKHTRAIVAGAWSAECKLALGSTDNTLSLSESNGDAVSESVDLKASPTFMQFSNQKRDNGLSRNNANAENTISINLDGKTLLLYNIDDPDNPVELAFQAKYGKIVAFRWFGDGYLLIGFSEGWLVVISTHINEIGEELRSARFHSDGLEDIAYSPTTQRCATIGGNSLKIIETSTLEELTNESISIDTSAGAFTQVDYAMDGQVLTAATTGGYVYTYLGKMPELSDSHESKIAYLSSLKEITVFETSVPSNSPYAALSFPLEIEPSRISLGSYHFAAAMNNTVWYYGLPLPPAEGQVSNKRELEDYRDEALEKAKAEAESRTYMSTVDDMALGSNFVAVLCDGKVNVHSIRPQPYIGNSLLQLPEAGKGDSIILPEHGSKDNGPQARVTCVECTAEFVVYGTEDGTVDFFYIPAWKLLASAQFRNTFTSTGIRAIYPNPTCTRVLIIDEEHKGYIFNPSNRLTIEIEDFPRGVTKVMWDPADWGVFSAFSKPEIHVFRHVPLTLNGASVIKFGDASIGQSGDITVTTRRTELPSGAEPLLVNDGIISYRASSDASAVESVTLSSYRPLVGGGQVNTERRMAALAQALLLGRFDTAWELCLTLGDQICWLALANKAMEVLDIDRAIDVYRFLGDAGMVFALEAINEEEDQSLVAGHLAVLFNDFSLAQELFLSSSRPTAALQMYRDMMHFEQATTLAETLDPSQVPTLQIQHAKQLEFKGDYNEALELYDSAKDELPPLRETKQPETTAHTKKNTSFADLASEAEALLGETKVDKKSTKSVANPEQAGQGGFNVLDHTRLGRLHRAAHDGLARCLLHTGNIRRGLDCVQDQFFAHKRLLKEAGGILDSLNQYKDAARMYERAEEFEKAASILIANKAFREVEPLMDKVASPKLHLQFAKAMEASKDYSTAVKSYERAKDMDNVVRLLVDHLDQPERAGKIVRQTKSAEAATYVSRYCQEINDNRGAVEFLLLAKKRTDAFSLAMAHEEMQVYVDALRRIGWEVTNEDHAQIASYYEGKGKYDEAARHHFAGGDYHKALKLFLQCGEQCLEEAIEVVGKANTDPLTHMLIDYLMGEMDGVQKDEKYIFKLYIVLENYEQAARTARIIAQHEAEEGKYRAAHDFLYKTRRDLISRDVRVPTELSQQLELLHSYILVKKRVKLGDHVGAAFLLKRVVSDISSFPKHTVEILTSAVIECQRAGLKRSAYEYATMLMRPEYRNRVDEKFRRKIEQLVRRPKTEEADQVSCVVWFENIFELLCVHFLNNV
eukprot:gb/GECG01010788.1/.p1 GENE.gb/GECG01010788.1/~~gb/GECG01010788.1/.p1  ORF type:complete len:1429 (+),score=207.41 gb/GECG01010788.1/:1-4287(+)